MQFIKLFFIFLLCYPIILFSQNLDDQLDALNAELALIKAQEDELLAKIEQVKLQKIQVDLNKNGLPKVETGETVIYHSAMSLVYYYH